MGAEVFTCRAVGKDAHEAFDNAVRQAQYDYGHAGYTGTIAEKNCYVLVSQAPMTMVNAEDLADRLLRAEDPRIDDKWGPAGAIPLAEGGFYFFGWASS